MWSPTHVQVTVFRAKNLIVKGKSGKNDSYVTIKLGDEKYQTSIKERSVDPAWMEECDLPLADPQGVVHLNVYHRNLLGIDVFLGHTDISLEQFKIYERPRSRWYALKNKAGSKKAEKYRGEIEIKITFIVQSMTGSQMDIAKKGSFIKRSGSIKTLAHSVGEKLTKNWPSKGSLTTSGSKPDLSSGNSDIEEPCPAVRKLDRRDLTRSHTILPTSFNNQYLEEDKRANDQVDGSETNKVKDREFDRWQNVGQGHDVVALHDGINSSDIAWYYGSPDGSIVDSFPLAPFRRKKRSRLSKMNLLSQSTHTLDRSIASEPPDGDLEEEDKDEVLSHNLRPSQLLAKSMFDLSTPSIDDLAKDALESETWEIPQMQKTIQETTEGEGQTKGHGHVHSESSIAKEKVTDHSKAGSELSPQSSELSNKNRGAVHPPFQERAVDVISHQVAAITDKSLSDINVTDSCIPTSESSKSNIHMKPPKPPRSAVLPVTDDHSGQGQMSNPQIQSIKEEAQGHTVEGHDETQEEATTADSPLESDLKFESRETIATENSKDERSMYISSSDSDLPASPEASPMETNRPSSTAQKTDEKMDEQISPLSDNSSPTDLTNKTSLDDKKKEKVDKYKKMKEVKHRHTFQYGRNNVPRAAAHDLHEGIAEYRQRALEYKQRELPAEVIKQFDEKSREDLIRLILEQNAQLHKKELYNRDLESYIDNLLVKVMEATPKILQHPSTHSPLRSRGGVTNGIGISPRSPSTPLMLSAVRHRENTSTKSVQSNNNVMNANNSNNRPSTGQRSIEQNAGKMGKKPFNPFKKFQQALK